MSRTVTTRLDEKSVQRIDELAARKGVDRSSFLRALFSRALKDQVLRDSLGDYEAGKITLWEAADRCSVSLWELIQEVKQSHIHASYDLQALRDDLERMGI